MSGLPYAIVIEHYTSEDALALTVLRRGDRLIVVASTSCWGALQTM